MAGKFKTDFASTAALLPHATPREKEAIESLLATGTGPAACAKLGISRPQFYNRLGGARRRALTGAGVSSIPGFDVTKVTTGKNDEVTAVQHKPSTIANSPIPSSFTLKKISQFTDGEGREIARWSKFSQEDQDRYDGFGKALRELATEVPPKPATPKPMGIDKDIATWLPWGDPHIGMLAWTAETGEPWDLKIAEQTTAQVMADLIDRTPRSSQFVLADLGDLFHAEDDRQVTPTAGHKLDVDSRAGKITRVGLRCASTAIDLALLRHDKVLVHLLRGNHDPYKTLALGIWLEARYQNEPRVTIAPFDNPYQFWSFGKCSVMLHHGDGSKPQQMGGIFSCDKSWGTAEHRYCYTGHIHNQSRWDLPGCSVESFRTLAPADYWAHWKGYRSRRTLDAITLHKDFGEISRVQQGIHRR